MKNPYRMPLSDYTQLAGDDWPSFPDYIKGKIPKKVEAEILQFEEQIYKESRRQLIEMANKANAEKFTLKNKKFLLKYFSYKILPAILCTWLYFYLGGSLLKFFVLFLCIRFLNIMHSQVMHRWFTHGMFEPKKWARPILLWFAVAGLHSSFSIAGYVIPHRVHHKEGDTELDPYPPAWGLLNLITLKARYVYGGMLPRWLIAPDIKFVARNMVWLYLLNLAIFAYIDLDIVLLVPLFIWLYGHLDDGFSDFLLHDGFKSKQPVDYPVFGYFVSWFVAIESVHKVHTEKPWVFNQAKHVPGAIDLGYWLLKPFAATEKE